MEHLSEDATPAMNPEQRAQVFCTECHKSMAVVVPVPEFCECVHCKKEFPAGGEAAPKTPPLKRITGDREPAAAATSRPEPGAPLGRSTSPEIFTPSQPPGADAAPSTALDSGPPPRRSGDRSDGQARRVMMVVAAFIVVAGASFLGGALTGGKNEEAGGGASEATAGKSEGVPCNERLALISRTGKFQGAKLRADPGFEFPQKAIVTKGAYVSVCEKAETPGEKVPNIWYRISKGAHAGLWVHGNVLELK